MIAPEDRTAVQVALTNTYRELGRAWSGVLADRSCDSTAPWAQWRERDPDGPVTAWDVLVQGAELTGNAAANAVHGHLALLGRAYWPDLHDQADDLIPHPAIYPPARAVLEATAVVIWTLDPGITPDDRAVRAAELLLWSQAQRRRPEAGWHELARDAGLDVRAFKRRPDEYYVRTGDGSTGLTFTRMIETTHGIAGAELYRAWNPDTHPDPLTMAARATVRPDGTGYHVGGLIREDRDVEVAIEVTELVAAATDCITGYYGRNAAPAAGCRAIAADLRQFLPVVAKLVDERNARAFD